MSGALAMMLGVAAGPGLGAIGLSDTQTTPTHAIAALQFNTDGTMSYSGNGSTGSPNWYQPTTTSIGNSYWVRIHVNSGLNPTSGPALDTVLALSASRNWTWNVALTDSSNCTVSVYSDSGGTILVAQSTFAVTLTVA